MAVLQQQIQSQRFRIPARPALQHRDMARLTNINEDSADRVRDCTYAAPDQEHDPYALAAPVKTILSKGLSPDLFMPPPPEEEEHSKDQDDAVKQGHQKTTKRPSSSKQAKSSPQATEIDRAVAEAQSKRADEEDKDLAAASTALDRRTLIGREAMPEVYEDSGEESWTLVRVRKVTVEGRQ